MNSVGQIDDVVHAEEVEPAHQEHPVIALLPTGGDHQLEELADP